MFSLMVIVAAILIFIFLTFRIGKKKGVVAGLNTIRICSRLLSMLLLVRISVTGRDIFKMHTGPYIIVFNHSSFLDIPAVSTSVPFGVRYLGKIELAKVPVFGYIMRKMTVAVDRKNKADREKSVESLRKSLEEGVSIFIAPEGTRNKTNEPLQNFYDGAFRLALQTKVPLLVVTILNAGKLLPPDKRFQLSPGKIRTFIDEPVWIKETDTIETLKIRTRQLMLSHLVPLPDESM